MMSTVTHIEIGIFDSNDQRGLSNHWPGPFRSFQIGLLDARKQPLAKRSMITEVLDSLGDLIATVLPLVIRKIAVLPKNN